MSGWYENKKESLADDGDNIKHGAHDHVCIPGLNNEGRRLNNWQCQDKW